ncbi:MAG: efflux RND transporter periplasmic adaptor subunit [Thermodesulfobacteriota bacterium]
MVQTPSDLGDGSRSRSPLGERRDGQGSDFDQDLWLQFAEATTPKSFCQSWLSLQCHMLKDVRSALVLLGIPDQGPFTPAAVWPKPGFDVRHLTGAAERALRERRGLLLKPESAPPEENLVIERQHIAYPIEVSGKLHGVVVLEVDERSGYELQTTMRQLHWGASWLEVMLRRTEAMKAAETNERLQGALELVASVVEHERFQAAAMAFVSRLATKLECDRVSLGMEHRGRLRVHALSHSAEFGKQMNLVRDIGSAMDEAIDQKAVVIYPLPSEGSPLVTRAHEALARHHESGTICTIPLRSNGKFWGGLTLERPANKPFDQATIEFCESIASLVGPILDGKRREERWLITKVSESFATQLKKVFGPGHLLLKMISILVAGLVIFFTFAMGDYRVTAPTTLEGTIQRALSAPYNGYISEARVRAGDLVKEGELLCLLDDRDLKLERLRWVSQREQLLKQHREAMAKHDRPQIRIIGAKIEQAEAQISLLDEQLIRTKVLAPFDGVVIKGDLSQSLGAPVEKGQVLFEVAPLESYRVIMEVDERDITEVALNQKGELVLSSMPDDVFRLVIEKITPVSVAKEGRNYFRVEARLEDVSERLRPGMEGVGKIYIDRRKLIWIWTHELIDWVRLKLWTWIP